jgi:hypothetical protein
MSYSRGPQRDPSPRTSLGPSSFGRPTPPTPAMRGENGTLRREEEGQQGNRFMTPPASGQQSLPAATSPKGMMADPPKKPANRYAVMMGVFFVAFLAYLLFLRSKGDVLPNSLRGISDAFVFFGSATCTVACFQTSRKLRIMHNTTAAIMARRSANGWLFLGLAALVYTIGQGIWTGFEFKYDVIPFPSWYDPFYLAVYPFSWIGIALLIPRSGSAAGRARLLLDTAIVIACTLAIFWYFILGPTIATLGDSAILKFVSLAYPIGDLSLAVAAALLLFGPSGAYALAKPLGRLAIGVTWLALTDALYAYSQLQYTYHTGLVQDIGWPMSWLFIGFAALAYPASLSLAATERLPEALSARRSRLTSYGSALRATTPMALTLVTFAILGYAVVTQNIASFTEIIIVSILLFVLPITRQLLTLIDNIALNERLRVALGQSQQAFQQSQQELLRTTTRAQQYEELRAGIEDIQAVHAQLAKGELRARAKVEGPLTPVAQSLNLLIDRLQRWAQFEQTNKVMESEANALREALEKLSEGRTAAFPSSRSTLLTGAALVALVRHQRNLVQRFARLREAVGTIGTRWKAAKDTAHDAQKLLMPGSTTPENILAARDALFQVEQKLDSNLSLLQELWLQTKLYDQPTTTGEIEFSQPAN